MPTLFHWDDARVLLALARAGNGAAAAATLGVSAPTIGRRLRALERAIGRTLVRHRDGQLVLTSAGQRLIGAAERMELASTDLERAANSEDGTKAPVRVTTIASVAQLLLRRLSDFLMLPEAPPIELIVTSQALSLSRGEADLALRMGRLLRADGLRCRRLAAVSYALYRHSSRTATSSSLLNDAPTVMTHGNQMSNQAAWVNAEAARSDRSIRLRISDPTLRLEACALGLGTALLPCFQGDTTPGLERIGQPVSRLTERIYLLAHPEGLARSEVRSVADTSAIALSGIGRA